MDFLSNNTTTKLAVFHSFFIGHSSPFFIGHSSPFFIGHSSPFFYRTFHPCAQNVGDEFFDLIMTVVPSLFQCQLRTLLGNTGPNRTNVAEAVSKLSCQALLYSPITFVHSEIPDFLFFYRTFQSFFYSEIPVYLFCKCCMTMYIHHLALVFQGSATLS